MENGQRNLQTERLILRPFLPEDAERVSELAGDPTIAATTLSIPHPYPVHAAESWIETCGRLMSEGSRYAYALVIRDEGALIGCVSLNLAKPHRSAELAYWIGRPYWRRGYATEAAKELIRFGFGDLGLNRIWAAAMTRNPASSSVMAKAGMTLEGTLRQHILKGDTFEDLVYYGIVRSEYDGDRLVI